MKDSKEFRLVLFGSGDFPIPTFITLLEQGYNIVGVVTSHDKVRFNNTRIEDIAKEHNIPCFIPNDLEDTTFIKELDELNPDIFVVISYKMLPQSILNIPKIDSFNIHASCLPYLRGSAPINWALYHGFEETGLTAFILNPWMDCGNIIASKKVKIEENDTFGTLHELLSNKCIDLTLFILDNIFTDVNYNSKSIPQMIFKSKKMLGEKCKLNPFLAPKLNKDNTKINWNCSIKSIYNQIRAFSPYPGASVTLNIRHHINSILSFHRYNFKLFDVTIVSIDSLSDDIKCQITQSNTSNIITDKKTYMYYFSQWGDFTNEDYVLQINTLQLEGKKTMPIKAFLNGFKELTHGTDTLTYNFY